MCSERTCPRYSGYYQGPLREDVEIKLCERCRVHEAYLHMKSTKNSPKLLPETIETKVASCSNCLGLFSRAVPKAEESLKDWCPKCMNAKPKPAPPAPDPKPEGWISTSDQPYGTKAIMGVYRIRTEVHEIRVRTWATVYVVQRRERHWFFWHHWKTLAILSTELQAVELIKNLQQPMKYFEVKHPA